MSTPPKPVEPNEEDCCGNGCSVCVHDIYAQELRLWECKRKTQDSLVPSLDFVSYVPCTLTRVTQHAPLVNIYRFSFPLEVKCRLEHGQHVIAKIEEPGIFVTRPYTPIFVDGEGAFMDVMIKIYPNGRMSKWIERWKVGETVMWRGPLGEYRYKPNTYRKVVMLAVGTGIAPLYRVIEFIMECEDETFVHLLYGNSDYNHILLRKQLRFFEQYWNFTCVHVLTSQKEDLKVEYGEKVIQGRIDKEMLGKQICDDLFVLLCGNRVFEKEMLQVLRELHVQKKRIFKF